MNAAVGYPICTMPELLTTVDGFECATCGHEWLAELSDGLDDVRDANGNLLASGDDVIVIKDHPIDGKVNGRGILIKAEFVRKA